MRFWDSSALVPLVIEEATTRHCQALLSADPAVAVWALTRTEILSAVRRKERAGELQSAAAAEAIRRLDRLERSWTELGALEPVRDRADRLLAVHPLRAADALQLAAALVLVEDRPRGWQLVTRDERLAVAATAEGFDRICPVEEPR